ncbi:MAG: HAD family hydrolase [Chloroflexi bacterium]|nr:HAD family hydrolase [Chloroflexota bacterium]MDA1004320.1 HAD family hydrolase [Chloroflexota bacterium]
MLLDTRAVLFDLDDTLIDFSGNQVWAWSEACRAESLRLGGLAPEPFADLIRTIGAWFWSDADRHRTGRRDLRAASTEIVRLAFERAGVSPADPDTPRAIAHHFRDLREAGVALVPGALELLEALRARGCALALVTNGTAADQRKKIDQFELARHFDHIQIEGEFGAGKPEEAVYHAALAALAAAPGETTFVGDNLEWDVAAPMRIGVQAVWVDVIGGGLPTGHAARPRRIVRSVAELHDEL